MKSCCEKSLPTVKPRRFANLEFVKSKGIPSYPMPPPQPARPGAGQALEVESVELALFRVGMRYLMFRAPDPVGSA